MTGKRYMGIDLGDVRVGIAVSDIMGIVAGALETYRRQDEEADLQHICKLIEEQNVGVAVVGLPLNMDGSRGPRALMAEEWGAKLKERTAAKVVFQDERLTTVSSERVLIESGMRREKRKGVIDRVAATIILQTYLDNPLKIPL